MQVVFLSLFTCLTRGHGYHCAVSNTYSCVLASDSVNSKRAKFQNVLIQQQGRRTVVAKIKIKSKSCIQGTTRPLPCLCYRFHFVYSSKRVCFCRFRVMFALVCYFVLNGVTTIRDRLLLNASTLFAHATCLFSTLPLSAPQRGNDHCLAERDNPL